MDQLVFVWAPPVFVCGIWTGVLFALSVVAVAEGDREPVLCRVLALSAAEVVVEHHGLRSSALCLRALAAVEVAAEAGCHLCRTA